MLLVLLQVKLLVVFAWADYYDPLKQQLHTTGGSLRPRCAGWDWAAACKQLATINEDHKFAEVGHVAEALVAAKALGCAIQSDMLAVMLPMLERSNQFYGGTFQHWTKQHKGMWRTILADGQIDPGMSLEALTNKNGTCLYWLSINMCHSVHRPVPSAMVLAASRKLIWPKDADMVRFQAQPPASTPRSPTGTNLPSIPEFDPPQWIHWPHQDQIFHSCTSFS